MLDADTGSVIDVAKSSTLFMCAAHSVTRSVLPSIWPPEGCLMSQRVSPQQLPHKAMATPLSKQWVSTKLT
jgi:hypothetical protein